jgi:hypothetical protein
VIVLSWPSKPSQSVVAMLAFNTTASTLGKAATLEAKDFSNSLHYSKIFTSMRKQKERRSRDIGIESPT